MGQGAGASRKPDRLFSGRRGGLLARARNRWRRLRAGLGWRSECVWPGLVDDLFLAHLSIYEFASGFVAGREVLDAGCGCGYGSHLLVDRGAGRVLGIDVNPRNVRYARRHYSGRDLQFEVRDCDDLNLEGESFDAVVCSNVIEHLEFPGRFVRRLGGLLREGGNALVVTPPISDEHSARRSAENVFHRSNLLVSDWVELFRREGFQVEMRRHDFCPGIETLDFGLPVESSKSVSEFTFPEATLEDLCTLPTLSAVFLLQRGPRASGPPAVPE